MPLELPTDQMHPSDTQEISGMNSDITWRSRNKSWTFQGYHWDKQQYRNWAAHIVHWPWTTSMEWLCDCDGQCYNCHSFLPVDYKAQSLYYFIPCAVLDQIDFSLLSDEVLCTAVDPKSTMPAPALRLGISGASFKMNLNSFVCSLACMNTDSISSVPLVKHLWSTWRLVSQARDGTWHIPNIAQTWARNMQCWGICIIVRNMYFRMDKLHIYI